MNATLVRTFFIAWVIVVTFVSSAYGLDDYDPNGSDWNGLERFTLLGDRVGIEVEPADTIAFDELTPSTPVIIVYPKTELDARNLSRFIISGGRVLLVDDFGQSDALLNRLEITRLSPGITNLPHDTFFDDNPAMPILKPRGRHPLLDDVKEIVANHPVVVTNVGGPVVAYDRDAGFAYDMNLGKGKAIVVADASILINQMIDVGDNEKFALNALKYLCNGQPDCKPLLVTKSFTQTGAFRRDSLFDGDVSKWMDGVNDLISDTMKAVPSTLVYVLTLIIALGFVIYSFSIFPIKGSKKYSRYVGDTLSIVPSPQSEFDWNISRFRSSDGAMTDGLPMSILKEVFEELFLGALDLWPSSPEERPKVSVLCQRYANTYLASLTSDERANGIDDLERLLAVLAGTPTRSRVFLENDVEIGRDDLVMYHRIAKDVLKRMDLEDDYERRVWGVD